MRKGSIQLSCNSSHTLVTKMLQWKIYKIEINTFLEFQFVSNPTFSPDGKYIAFIVSTADKADNNYKGNIYVYDMEAKKVVKLTSGGDAKSYSAERPDELITSFAVVSDIHVETNNPKVYQKLSDVLYGIKAGKDIDAVIYTGDNVMNGQILESLFFYSAVRGVMPAENNFVITGNHDLGNGEGDYNTFHDRFILIDKKELYHSGASFKDLGKKCFCISKIENDNVLKELLKIVNS